MKDTRGRRSKTLFFVTASWLVLLAKFIVAGVTVQQGESIVITLPPMGGLEFGAAVAAVLAVWVGREWKDKELNGSATEA